MGANDPEPATDEQSDTGTEFNPLTDGEHPSSLRDDESDDGESRWFLFGETQAAASKHFEAGRVDCDTIMCPAARALGGEKHLKFTGPQRYIISPYDTLLLDRTVEEGYEAAVEEEIAREAWLDSVAAVHDARASYFNSNNSNRANERRSDAVEFGLDVAEELGWLDSHDEFDPTRYSSDQHPHNEL